MEINTLGNITCPPITPKKLKQVFLHCRLEPLSFKKKIKIIYLFIYIFQSNHELFKLCTKMYMAKLT